LETLTNLESPSYNNLARIAKDVAAGAVLFWAMVSLIVGAGIFFQKERLIATLIFFWQNPIISILYFIIILLLIIFIFKGIKINKEYIKIYNIKNLK
ncbi:MAG: diacylglycerol kinase family protein, partial [Oscillospiraceae bacterium]